ncbi:unnamed protein product [Closterium sp. NIES-53]
MFRTHELDDPSAPAATTATTATTATATAATAAATAATTAIATAATTAPTAATAPAATAAPACCATMALLRVLAFDHKGRPIQFDTWLDDLQLYLLSDSKDSVSLFDLASGAATAPPATADSVTHSQWLTRDAAARLAIRNHLRLVECAHFGHHWTAQALYDAVDARYSSPAIAALGRLFLPYLFPELSAFATVEDLVCHLCTSDVCYRTTVLAEFLDRNQAPMFITLYFIVTRLPDSLRSIRDHFLSLDPTSLTVDLLEQHLLAAETSAVAVGAARGTPRPPFFEGCSPSSLAPFYASVAAADVLGAEDVGDASASAKHRSGKGKGSRRGGGGSGSGGGGSSGGSGGSGGGGNSGSGGGGGSGGGSGGVGGGGGGSGGSGGSGGGGTGGGRTGARRGGFTLSTASSPASTTLGVLSLVTTSSALTGQICLDLGFDVILSAMYALSVSAEGDCYWCVPPDPGIAAAPLGASESGTLPGTSPAEALHTFTLDSGASRCFFCDSTTLTPLPTPVPVRLADPSGGPVFASSSTVLPCPAVPSGSLSGLHLPSFSTILVSTAALQDAMVTTTTLGGQRVSICTCTRTGPHLATFTRQPRSSLYTLATKSPQVAASARVSASGQVSASPPALACSALPSLRSGAAAQRSSLLISLDDCSPVDSPHRRGQVVDVLIPRIRTVCLQLHERFSTDFPVLRLHSDRGGEFSSDLLRDFCRGEGILKSFMLPASLQQNGIAERRIGLVMEVARTSMIHVAAPHFLWPFAVSFTTLPHAVSSPLRASCLTSLFPYRSAPLPPLLLFLAPGPPPVDPLPPQGPAPSGVSQVDPPPGAVPGEVAVDSRAARGTAAGGAEPGGADTGGRHVQKGETLFEVRANTFVSANGCARVGANTNMFVFTPCSSLTGGAEPGGAETGGAELGGAETGVAEPEGVELQGTESEGADCGDGEPQGAASSGATGAGGARDAGAGGAGVTAGAGGPGGACTRGTRAAGIGGVWGAGAGDPTEPGAAGGGGSGAGGAGAEALPLPPASPLPAPSPYTEQSGGLTERREHASRPFLLRDYELYSLDFSTAFLQGSLHEEIWLRRPPGFTGLFPAGTQWGLFRPVYGLRQAPCEWHDTLRTTLAALGFAPSTVDPSLFLRTDTSLPPFYVLVYVDDLVFVKLELQKRHTCSDLGELRSYLGLQITRDRARRTITLTQSHMVHQSIEPSGPYPELVGCLMYLMTCTRPGLVYPLSLLARYVAPGRHRKVHWDAVKRVLRYLCSTSGIGLVLGGRGPVVLTGHADASRVDDSATQRSSQGSTFSLGSGSFSWWSTRSSLVLSSSCEAEIYAGAMAAQQLRWFTYLLTELGEQPRSPPVLCAENKAMIALCQEHRLEHRTKHIALRYFLARVLQQRGQLCLAYVATRANTADIFTKALPPGDHQRFSTVLGLVPTLPHLLTA